MSIDYQMRPMLAEAKQTLDAFVSSSQPFRILKTVPPQTAAKRSPRTLFILDSSFNPPSAAHMKLATTAIASSTIRYPRPCRLLLLFSSHNADKSPSPAAFEHRLALMVLLAQELSKNLETGSAADKREDHDQVAVDVGLTNKPFYNDKSTAIEEVNAYPSNPQHIHLVGFDTFTRILDPKYYKNSNPPLAALDSFFDKHGLQVTIRPSKDWGDEETQKRYLERLQKGAMEDNGAKRQWAEHVEMVEASGGAHVSSTKARAAAKDKDWRELQRLCPPSIAAWIREESLYRSD